MNKINCTACGSIYVKTVGNFIFCESCDSKFEREVPQTDAQSTAPPPNVISEGFYPFTISEETCREILTNSFLHSADAPEDLALHAKITEIKRTFIPLFYIHASYRTLDGQKRGVVTANEIVNKEFANDFDLDIEQEPGWKDLNEFDDDQTLIMPIDDISTKLDSKLIQLAKDELEHDEKFNITSQPNSEVLFTPFYTGTYNYNGESYAFAIEGRGLSADIATPSCEKVKVSAPRFFKGVGFYIALICTSLMWLYTGGVMPFCNYRDTIAGTVATFSALALVLGIAIGIFRRSTFAKATESHTAEIATAVNEGGASIERALASIEKRRKKRSATRKLSNIIAALFLLAIIGMTAVTQHTTIVDMLEARRHTREVAEIQQELANEMAVLAEGLRAALDNDRIMSVEVYPDRQGRRRVRVYLDSRYLSSNRGISSRQLGDMLYQMVAYFDEPEEEMPFGRYRIVARIPGSNNNVRAAFWPAPSPGRDFGNQTRFTVRYYLSGRFDSQVNYPFPNED